MGRRLGLALGVLIVVVVGAIAWLVWPRGTTEVTKKEAIDRFRQNDRTTTSAAPGDASSGSKDGPAVGVYTFDATGSEKIKIGPLPTESRPLPATVTASVVDAGDGCFDWTVNLFAEHTEDTRWCRDGMSLRLASHVKHQKVGAITPTVNVTCDPAVFVANLGKAGTSKVRCKLGVEGGPFSVKADLDGEATWSEPETRTIGGSEVTVRRLAIHYPVTGTENGVWDETIWFDEHLVPVQMERSFHLSGPANFDETNTLTLRSLTPDT